jgi:hypothetical protein
VFQNPTVNLSALCNSCAKIACCSSELIFTFFMLAAAPKMRASNLSGASTFIVHTSLNHPAIRLVHPTLFCTLLFIIQQFVSYIHLYFAHFSSSSSNSSRTSNFILHTSLHHPAIRLVHPPLFFTLLFIIQQFVSYIHLYFAHFSSSSSNSSRASTFILHTSLHHPAIRLVHPPLFFTLLFIIQPHKQKSNVVGSADSNMSISVNIQNYTRVHTNFFLSQWPIESPLKIPNFLPDSACIYRPRACCHIDNLTFCTHSIYVTRVIIKINNDFTTQI